MSLRSTLAQVRRHLLCSIYRRVVPLEGSRSFVSFTFDDFPRTAYTVGGPILKSFGVRGTYYVAMGLMNTQSAAGAHFHVEDLRALVGDGHELATHTFGHVSSRGVSPAAFREDALKGQAAIRETANLAATGNFAYPYGEVTLAAKHALAKDMLSCRSIYGGVNSPLVDLNLLLANSLYGDLNGLEAVRRLIGENEARKGWLIFYTHDIQRNPSPYGCTPRFFESAVRLAVDRCAQVLPVAEVLRGVIQESASGALQRMWEAVTLP